jgi:hypothetical protein
MAKHGKVPWQARSNGGSVVDVEESLALNTW